MSKKQKKMLTRIMAAAFGVILLNFVPVTGILRFTLYLAVFSHRIRYFEKGRQRYFEPAHV